MGKPKPCDYCGAAYHQPYDDGLTECRIALRGQLDDVQEENDRLRSECAQISKELGLPPTMRPAEGEFRRMQAALGEVERLHSQYESLRETLGEYRCIACSIEAEIGTEEKPHPVPIRFHACGWPRKAI